MRLGRTMTSLVNERDYLRETFTLIEGINRSSVFTVYGKRVFLRSGIIPSTGNDDLIT